MQAALRRLAGRRWVLRTPEATPRPRCAGPGSVPALRCWSCGSPLPAAEGPPRFCPGCRALQPPEHRPDLFRLMNCDRSFRVDAQQLQRRFRSLQLAVHPDRFGQRPPKEQRFSEQHSSLINKAYQTLLNPLSRGLYLEPICSSEEEDYEIEERLKTSLSENLPAFPLASLELHGVEPAQETDYDADSVFLMEIMEINEKLSESENEDSLQEMETLIKAKQEELTKEVTAAFERDDLQEAKKLLAKMKYFANLEDKLKQKKIPS